MQLSLPSILEIAQAGTFGLKLPALPASPYVGLRPFNSDEALLFFGRGQQTIELLQQLHRTHFVGIVGSSGCGKSSLVRAGLIPKLKAGFLVEEHDQWLIATLKPGDAPLEHLAEALQQACGSESLTDAINHADAPKLLAQLAPALDAADANLLLLVDQFEELFRFGLESGKAENRAAATRFVDLLLALTVQRQLPVYVVLTMRSDFLGDCDNFFGLPEALNRSQYLVPRLTREQLRQSIEGPLHLFGARMSPQLLNRILMDIGDQSDQLPVLQHALMRTWEWWEFENARRGDLELDLPHYEAAGTITDALSKDADAALAAMSDEQRQITERIFRTLTDTDENNRRIRRPARMSELCASAAADHETVWQIIKRFSDNPRSFLTISAGREPDDPLIDISHESLIRQWGKLGEWMDAEDQAREIYLRLATAARRHQQLGTPFYSGIDLEEALKWRDECQPNAAWGERYNADFALAMEFLAESQKSWEEFERSIQELDREEETNRKRKLRRTRLFAAVVSALLIAAIGLAWYAWQQKQRAVAQEQKAQQLNYVANMNLAYDANERGNTARVYELLDAFLPGVDKTGLGALRGWDWYHLWRQHHQELATLKGHEGLVHAVAFAPDGQTLASASVDQTVKLWSVTSGQVLVTLKGHEDYVNAVAFAPDGHTLASASRDQTVKLWSVKRGQVLATLKGHEGSVYAVAFAPDGQTLASASGAFFREGKDNSVKLWSVKGEQVLATLKGHEAAVRAVAFAPDGQTLASASFNEKTGQGEIILRFTATEAEVARQRNQ